MRSGTFQPTERICSHRTGRRISCGVSHCGTHQPHCSCTWSRSRTLKKADYWARRPLPARPRISTCFSRFDPKSLHLSTCHRTIAPKPPSTWPRGTPPGRPAMFHWKLFIQGTPNEHLFLCSALSSSWSDLPCSFPIDFYPSIFHRYPLHLLEAL